MRELRFWHHSGVDPFGRGWSVISAEEFRTIQEFVQGAGHADLPVVIGPGMVYTQLAHYAPQNMRARLVYLTDAQKELSTEGNDTVVKVLAGLQSSTPLDLVDYSEFIARQQEFLFYSEGHDWALTFLDRDAASLRLVSTDGNHRWLYLVTMKDKPYQPEPHERERMAESASPSVSP